MRVSLGCMTESPLRGSRGECGVAAWRLEVARDEQTRGVAARSTGWPRRDSTRSPRWREGPSKAARGHWRLLADCSLIGAAGGQLETAALLTVPWKVDSRRCGSSVDVRRSMTGSVTGWLVGCVTDWPLGGPEAQEGGGLAASRLEERADFALRRGGSQCRSRFADDRS
jgi:hypothetical protein